MKSRISACMIVKDEEAHLARCLRSIRGAVDEIIVVDTGSRDATVEIARSFDAHVYFCPWEDNFSMPRNVSIEHAQGEWIFLIDADEQLESAARHTMQKLVRNKNLLGYSVLIEMHPDLTPMRSLRLFRNMPSLRFRGVFHEELTVPRDSADRVMPADIRIIHTPFNQEITDRKYERNVTLLRKHLNEYPDDAYQMLDLARLYLGKDAVAEAEILLQRARGIIFDHATLYSRQKLEVCRSFYYWLHYGCLLQKNSDIRERLAVCREAIETLPECPLFYYHAANLYYALQQYEAAIGHFEKCIAFGKQPARDVTILYPRECLSSLPLAGLGYCLFREKEYMQATRYFKASLAYKQDHAIDVMLASASLLAEKAECNAGSLPRP